MASQKIPRVHFRSDQQSSPPKLDREEDITPLTLPSSVVSSPPFGQDITFSLTSNVTITGNGQTAGPANRAREVSPASTLTSNDAARTSPKESAVAPTASTAETMPSSTEDSAATPASIMHGDKKLTNSAHSSQSCDQDVTLSPTHTISIYDTPRTSPKTCADAPVPAIFFSENLPTPTKDSAATPRRAPKTPPARPALTRNQSSFFRATQALVDYTGRFVPSRSEDTTSENAHRRSYKEKITSFARKKGSNSSSVSTSTINSPEIQAMIKNEVLPNLELVNQALEAVSNSPSDSEEEKVTCVNQLHALAERITIAHRDAKKVLTEAMQARDVGKKEICRGKCFEILKNPYAEAGTKVYAYNILSTQASPGQGEGFLDSARDLVNDQIKDARKRDHWLAVIRYLRGCLEEKAAAARANQGVREQKVEFEREETQIEEESEDGWYYHGHTRYRCSVKKALSSLRLKEVPTTDEPGREEMSKDDLIAKGAVTPKTEKILDWATEDMSGVRSAEDILCRCGDGDNQRLCVVHG